jgi:hypothetical protein
LTTVTGSRMRGMLVCVFPWVYSIGALMEVMDERG